MRPQNLRSGSYGNKSQLSGPRTRFKQKDITSGQLTEQGGFVVSKSLTSSLGGGGYLTMSKTSKKLNVCHCTNVTAPLIYCHPATAATPPPRNSTAVFMAVTVVPRSPRCYVPPTLTYKGLLKVHNLLYYVSYVVVSLFMCDDKMV